MILDWLVGEFRDLFAHDADARVLLWFDAKAEFRGLLPDLEEAVSSAGLSLLALDTQQDHGPLWMKWAAEAGPAAETKVVLWLPCPREALGGGASDDLRLEVLFEYHYRGLEWRIDGKQPTLFSFLKKHGVPLPARQSEQVPLWKGGGESPLARYVKKHAGRDQTFWHSRMLSLTIVQEGIVGSVEDRLLRCLADPDGELAVMRAEGIVGDFASQLVSEIADAQGIEEDPKAWSEAFVTGLVLLEVFETMGEPEDFPFISKLPSAERRERQLRFLRRWMRDAEYLPKYREWALAVEPSIDLASWARGREGRPQSLRALVRDRWAAFLAGLQDAGPDDTVQQAYLQQEKAQLVEESKGLWASDNADVPGWSLAADLADLADASVRACNVAASKHDPKSLVDSYASHWHAIDIAHWHLLAAANQLDDMEAVARIGDRFYFKYLKCTGQAFYESFRDGGVWPPEGCTSARDLVGALYALPSAGERKAVLIVDALRYELGKRLAEAFDDAVVDSVIAEVPSETWVGMSALVPGCDAELQIDGGHKLVSTAAGGDLCYLQYRKKLIAAAGAGGLPAGPDGKSRDQVSDVLDFIEEPPGLPQLLVLFDREIDTSGHGMGGKVIHHFDFALESTRRAIRRLQSWGYSEVHVVTDHGFVLLNSNDAVQKMEVDKGAFADSGTRWGILAHGASVPTAMVPFALDPRWSVAVPPGIRSFGKPSSEFFHGGATLQEVVIPHIVIKAASGQVLRMKAQALLPLVEVATMTVKVELRPERPDAESLLDTVQGTSIRVFLGEIDAPRSSEKIVSFDADATEPVSVTLFLNREPGIPKGSEIPLRVIDVDSGESYATGLFVRAARDLG